jgi:hypothetical protein
LHKMKMLNWKCWRNECHNTCRYIPTSHFLHKEHVSLCCYLMDALNMRKKLSLKRLMTLFRNICNKNLPLFFVFKFCLLYSVLGFPVQLVSEITLNPMKSHFISHHYIL